MLYECAQHEGDAPVVRAGAELAVGEGPGPALAALDVGLRVEGPAGAEGLHGPARGKTMSGIGIPVYRAPLNSP